MQARLPAHVFLALVIQKSCQDEKKIRQAIDVMQDRGDSPAHQRIGAPHRVPHAASPFSRDAGKPKRDFRPEAQSY